MTVEAKTVRTQPTGSVRVQWMERYGTQRATVEVDPGRRDPATEFRVNLDRSWGPQLTDHRTEGFWLPREGAELLRDALTAALDWTPDEDGEQTS